MLSTGEVADAAAHAAVLVHTALASLRVQNAVIGSSHHQAPAQHLVVELGKDEGAKLQVLQQSRDAAPPKFCRQS